MGVFQNYNIAPDKAITGNRCPRCGQAALPSGIYVNTSVRVPLEVRFLFFMINIGLRVGIKYCPRCGFLRVEVNKV